MVIKTHADLVKMLNYICHKCNHSFEIEYHQKYDSPYEFFSCPYCMKEFSFTYIVGGIKIGDDNNSNLLRRTVYKW